MLNSTFGAIELQWLLENWAPECHLGRMERPGIEQDIANEPWKTSPGSGPATWAQMCFCRNLAEGGYRIHCLDELASPRSQTAVLHSRFWKTQVGQKRVQKLRLTNGPISFSSSSCFLMTSFLLKPIQYIIDLRFPYWLPILLGINLHFTWKLFSLIFLSYFLFLSHSRLS